MVYLLVKLVKCIHMRPWAIQRRLTYLCGWAGWNYEKHTAACLVSGHTFRRQTLRTLYLVSFLLQFDSHWDIQQPITVSGWEQPTAYSLQATADSLQPSDAAVETSVSSAVQRCHILPLHHCKIDLKHLTQLYVTLSDSRDFGSAPCDPTEPGYYSRPTPTTHP
jgi:hypothetical protein